MRGEREMIAAAKRGRLQDVVSLIESGVDVHANHDQAIGFAAENGHLETVRYLLSKGALFTAGGNYALYNATSNGHVDVIELLISKYPQVDYNLLLKKATENGELKAVQFLIDKAGEYNFGTLSWMAAQNGHIEILKYLFVKLDKSMQALCVSVAENAASPNWHMHIVFLLYAYNTQFLYDASKIEKFTNVTVQDEDMRQARYIYNFSKIEKYLGVTTNEEVLSYYKKYRFDEKVEGKFIQSVFQISAKLYHLINRQMVFNKEWPSLSVVMPDGTALYLDQDVLEIIFKYAYGCANRGDIFYPIITPQPKFIDDEILSLTAKRYFAYARLFPVEALAKDS